MAAKPTSKAARELLRLLSHTEAMQRHSGRLVAQHGHTIQGHHAQGAAIAWGMAGHAIRESLERLGLLPEEGES